MSEMRVQPGDAIAVPEHALVILVGPDESGKSAFAARHFAATEIVSFDDCLGRVADGDDSDASLLAATELLHFIVAARMAVGRLTVVDAANLHPDERRPLVMLAKRHHCVPVAIAFDDVGDPDVSQPGVELGLRHQRAQLRRSLTFLAGEGMRLVWVVPDRDVAERVRVERRAMPSDLRDMTGPFDIVGDVHGCINELRALLQQLGWVLTDGDEPTASHPDGRIAVFVGDLVDRGPDSPAVLHLVMNMVDDGVALLAPGNHDDRLRRKLEGRDVRVAHGLEQTLRQLTRRDEAFHERVGAFLSRLPSHLVLDGGRLVVAHAGLHAEFHNRESKRVRDLALYGETVGDHDPEGPPHRVDWAVSYRGTALVVYGHTPVQNAVWRHRTINLDTGCVFGGALSALRYPEHEVVSVPAERTWSAPSRPIAAPAASGRAEDSVLPPDVQKRHDIDTARHGPIVVREQFAAEAVDAATVTVDRRWLVYIPPAVAPPDPPGPEVPLVERPHEALAYFADAGATAAMCYDDPIGVRVVIVACRDEISAFTTFGADDGRTGVVYTRAGAPAWSDATKEAALIGRLRLAMEELSLWDSLATDWIAIEGTLVPATGPARSSYYAAFTQQVTGALEDYRAADDSMLSSQPGGELTEAVGRVQQTRRACAEAIRNFVWQPRVLSDVRFAPRAILATAGRVRWTADQTWQIQTLAELAAVDELFMRGVGRVIDLHDRAARDQATTAWASLDDDEASGWTIAPVQWPSDTSQRVLPVMRCRTPARLRLLYGDDCLNPERIGAIRRRNVRRKRSLSFREHALAHEALQRFVDGEAHYRVHECIFGILALEEEPIDPRL